MILLFIWTLSHLKVNVAGNSKNKNILLIVFGTISELEYVKY